MYTHAPINYDCPFCHLANGENNEYNSQEDIVYKDTFVTAFVSPKWWVNNPENVFHYHMHVFPRYKDDNLYVNHKNYRFVTKEERKPYVEKLRHYFAEK